MAVSGEDSTFPVSESREGSCRESKTLGPDLLCERAEHTLNGISASPGSAERAMMKLQNDGLGTHSHIQVNLVLR